MRNNNTLITETERLSLSRFDTTDAAFILILLNTPGWLQFIGDKNIRTQNDAENYILSGPVKSYKKFGFGLYKVSLNNSGPSIGMCGLIKRENLEDIDIGFAFLPGYGGKGYAAEAVEAVMQYAKTQLKISRIAAITLPENTGSIRLLKRSGLQFEKMIQFPGENEELMLFVRLL